MKKLMIAVGVVAVGVGAAVALRRHGVDTASAGRAVADRVAAGADRTAEVSHDVTDRVQATALRAADTVEATAASIASRAEDAATAAASAAESGAVVVAETADKVATAAVESTIDSQDQVDLANEGG